MYQNSDYEETIDLMALFLHCLKHWKSILIVTVICAVFGGAYKGLEQPAEDVNAEARAQAAQQVQMCEEKVKEIEEDITASKLMQMNPGKVFRGTTGYMLDVPTEDNLAVMDMLTTYTSTALLKEMAGTEGYTESELSQMISLNKGEIHTKTVSRKVENGDVFYESTEEYGSFTINALGASEAEAEKLLSAAEKFVEGYVKQLGVPYGVDGIQRYIHSVSGVTVDSIRRYQDAMNGSLSAEKANLETAKQLVDSLGETPEREHSVKNIIVFFLLGGVVGAFTSCAFYAGIFIFGGRLYSVCDIEERFGVKVLGDLIDHSNEKGLQCWISGKEDGPYALLSINEKMRLFLVRAKKCLKMKKNIGKVFLIGTLEDNEVIEKSQQICEGLRQEGYNAIEYQCMWKSTEVIEKVQKDDIILLVESRDKSTASLLEKQIKIWCNYGGEIAGMVIL